MFNVIWAEQTVSGQSRQYLGGADSIWAEQTVRQRTVHEETAFITKAEISDIHTISININVRRESYEILPSSQRIDTINIPEEI